MFCLVRTRQGGGDVEKKICTCPQAAQRDSLDVAGFGTNNGAKVILWQCTGNTNQRWMPQIFEDGDPNAKILMGIHSGKCLDADNPAFTSGRVPGPGALLQVWDCVPDTEAGNLANQDWAFQW